jgi:Ni,Fe-hydrogenase maturation factor
MTHDFEKQILVAGVGGAWMQDDGFGSEAASASSGASCRRASR